MNFINQLLKNLKKRKVYSSFKDNIWGVDLADMQLVSKYNKRIRFLLHVIDIFSKYAWVVPLQDKKGVTIKCIKRISKYFRQFKKKTKRNIGRQRH